MAKLEADKDLGVILSPLDNRRRLQVLLIRHSQLLQQSVVGMKTFSQEPLDLMIIEVVVIIE